MIKQLDPYKFDSISNIWISRKAADDEELLPESFKLGSLNIMDEKYKLVRNLIIRDEERFTHMIKLLEEENFDVLALNEVTPRFLKRLQESEFFSQNYFFTDIVESTSPGTTNNSTVYQSLGKGLQGNLILSKVCPQHVHLLENPISKHFVMATFKINQNSTSSNLCIVSAHTLAYAKNVEFRRSELKSIANNPYIKDEVDQVIILGDLNLHSESEDEIINDIGFTDLWQETRNDKGFTFDPQINSFIRFKYLGMENRRMRLDRILVRNSTNQQQTKLLGACTRMELFANKPIHEMIGSKNNSSTPPLKTPLWYYLFNLIFEKTTTVDYLFYSDHFGMKVNLKLFENHQQLMDHHEKIKKESKRIEELEEFSVATTKFKHTQQQHNSSSWTKPFGFLFLLISPLLLIYSS